MISPIRVRPSRAVAATVFVGALFVFLGATSRGQTQGQSPQSSTARPVGAVKAINGNTLTVSTDSGSTLNVLVQEGTRILRIAPGQKELKDATPIKLQDLQIGDRMIIRGSLSNDAKSVVASSLLVMKKEDIQERQKHDREDWQKRGVGGLVKAIDPSSGAITLSTAAVGSTKTITVHVPKDAIVRRYAPGSVKFEDAKPGTLDQIKPGDQLCALGNRTTDGSEINPEEIVSGSFQNIAGTVVITAPGENTVQIMDLLTKRPITVKITADSQLKKLPPMLAQRIAARMKGVSRESSSPISEGNPSSAAQKTEPDSGEGGAVRPRSADLQQMLGRLPNLTVADLQKGDAVMLVATAGGTESALNVVTLLTGVEPILTAAPNGQGAAMLLSPWNLGSSAGETATE